MSRLPQSSREVDAGLGIDFLHSLYVRASFGFPYVLNGDNNLMINDIIIFLKNASKNTEVLRVIFLLCHVPLFVCSLWSHGFSTISNLGHQVNLKSKTFLIMHCKTLI